MNCPRLSDSDDDDACRNGYRRAKLEDEEEL